MTIKHNSERGYWEVQFYYKDYRGISRKKHKRGFKTKREAREWAEDFLAREAQNMDMTFGAFVALYYEDMGKRLRESTIRTKRYVVDTKILPFFEKKKICDITAADIRHWQAEMIGKGFSQTYLHTINNQLNAIFNYAVNYYNLPRNPVHQAGSIGKGKADEMSIWSQEEFEIFLDSVSDKPVSKYAFIVLFWTGMRIGELLALTPCDIDIKNKTININKSYQHIEGRDVITEPKTERGKRIITIPDFLAKEIDDYLGMLYGIRSNDRLFQVTKSFMEHEMERGIKQSGIKKIRLHDLRHSHASMLISQLKAEPLLVAQRLGHEKIQTTLETYSHLYPDQSRELSDLLDDVHAKRKEVDDDAGDTQESDDSISG